MKKSKRILIAILCVTTVLSSIPLSNAQASAVDENIAIDEGNNNENDINDDSSASVTNENIKGIDDTNKTSEENLNEVYEEGSSNENQDSISILSDENQDNISMLSDENQDNNISVASNYDDIDVNTASQSWDISLNGDGSVMAYFFDDGLLYITGNGTKKPFDVFNDDDYRSKSDQITKAIINGNIGGDWSFGFLDLVRMTSFDASNWNTSNVTNMTAMFEDCKSLESLDLSNFDTHNVVSIYRMFEGCSSLISLNVSSFNTSSIHDMFSMFRDCSSLTSLDLSNFDTDNVYNMEYMFYNCNKLVTLDLSNFDMTKVRRIENMFANSKIHYLKTPINYIDKIYLPQTYHEIKDGKLIDDVQYDVIPANSTESIILVDDNHQIGDYTTEKEPTCTEKGSKYKSCSICNLKFYEDIPATGHDLGEWTITQPTCIEKGLRERTCKNCGHKESYEIPADEKYHNFERQIIEEATCTDEGLTKNICTICGEESNLPIFNDIKTEENFEYANKNWYDFYINTNYTDIKLPTIDQLKFINNLNSNYYYFFNNGYSTFTLNYNNGEILMHLSAQDNIFSEEEYEEYRNTHILNCKYGFSKEITQNTVKDNFDILKLDSANGEEYDLTNENYITSLELYATSDNKLNLFSYNEDELAIKFISFITQGYPIYLKTNLGYIQMYYDSQSASNTRPPIAIDFYDLNHNKSSITDYKDIETNLIIEPDPDYPYYFNKDAFTQVINTLFISENSNQTISATGHSFTNYVSDNNATCQHNATKTAICDNGCGETDTIEIPNSKVTHKFTNYVSDKDNNIKKAYCDYGCGTVDTIKLDDNKNNNDGNNNSENNSEDNKDNNITHDTPVKNPEIEEGNSGDNNITHDTPVKNPEIGEVIDKIDSVIDDNIKDNIHTEKPEVGEVIDKINNIVNNNNSNITDNTTVKNTDVDKVIDKVDNIINNNGNSSSTKENVDTSSNVTLSGYSQSNNAISNNNDNIITINASEVAKEDNKSKDDVVITDERQNNDINAIGIQDTILDIFVIILIILIITIIIIYIVDRNIRNKRK